MRIIEWPQLYSAVGVGADKLLGKLGKDILRSEVGSDVIIDDKAGTVITLLNVAMADLGKGDFIF